MSIIEKYSAGGVIIDDDKVLTLYVPDDDEVVFPKGTIESGESPETTAVREVLEETGYRAIITDSLGTVSYEFEQDGHPVRKTIHYFLMRLVDSSETPQPDLQEDEVFENLWLPVEQAAGRLTHQESRDLLKRALDKYTEFDRLA